MSTTTTINDKDHDLVQACKAGDEFAFSQLFEKYSRKINGFARKYIGDVQHAEDVVQDVFLQVHRKIHGFRGDARFSTWLFRVTVNACKSKIAQLDRQRRLNEESSRHRPERPPETPERELKTRELRKDIEHCLDTLNDEQRSILLMKTVRKLSYIEIGEALNQSETQIRGKLYRARKAFRSSLETRYEETGMAA